LNDKQNFSLEEVNKFATLNRYYYVGIYQGRVETEFHLFLRYPTSVKKNC